MGAFFSNIQIYTPNTVKESIRDSIINFIKSYITKNGYIEVNEEDEADRTIAISQVTNDSWISIYDEALESQNINQMDKIVSDLSIELKTKAVGVTVHDSDIIRLGMFHNGNFVGELSNVVKRKKKMNPVYDFLEAINISGTSREDFLNAFTKKSVFAEEILHKIAGITNMDSTQCMSGFNYLNDVKIENLTYLRFKEKNKDCKYNEKTDSTKLSWIQGDGFTNKKVGDKGQYSCLFRNQGVASQGIQIILKGPAIENNAIKPENIKIFIYKNYHEESDEVTGTFWETVSQKGEKLIVANFPDFKIPEGCILPYLSQSKSQREMEEIFKKRYEIGFGVRLESTALTPAKSKFFVIALPLSNTMEGQDNCSVMVDISE